MAYASQINQTANDEADLLQKLHDFLVTTLGWTDHDDMIATDGYFVVTSTGEDGKAKLCMKFAENATAHRIDVTQYLSWNNSTHTGQKESGQNGYTYITSSDAAHQYWFYGDKDHIKVVTKVDTVYYAWYGGLYDTVYNTVYAITQASIAAGDDVSVDVDDASMLEEGEFYLIMDDTNCERAQITTISGNTITFGHLNNGYDSGARVGEDPMPNLVGYHQMTGDNSCAGCAQFYYNGIPSTVYSDIYTYIGINPSVLNYVDAAHRYPNRRYFFPVALVNKNGTYEEFLGYLKHFFTFDKSKQAVVSEDTIIYAGKTYDVFVVGTSNFVVIIPRSV